MIRYNVMCVILSWETHLTHLTEMQKFPGLVRHPLITNSPTCLFIRNSTASPRVASSRNHLQKQVLCSWLSDANMHQTCKYTHLPASVVKAKLSCLWAFPVVILNGLHTEWKEFLLLQRIIVHLFLTLENECQGSYVAQAPPVHSSLLYTRCCHNV